MSISRTNFPVSSYGPEFINLLRKAALETVVLEFPSYDLAWRFQQRLYKLRAQMRRENHELLPMAERVRTSLSWGTKAGYGPVEEIFSTKNVATPKDKKTKTKMTLQPADKEFTSIVTKAGISVTPLDDTQPPPDPKGQELDVESIIRGAAKTVVDGDSNL